MNNFYDHCGDSWGFFFFFLENGECIMIGAWDWSSLSAVTVRSQKDKEVTYTRVHWNWKINKGLSHSMGIFLRSPPTWPTISPMIFFFLQTWMSSSLLPVFTSIIFKISPFHLLDRSHYSIVFYTEPKHFNSPTMRSTSALCSYKINL